jgi:hypothetical protein
MSASVTTTAREQRNAAVVLAQDFNALKQNNILQINKLLADMSD